MPQSQKDIDNEIRSEFPCQQGGRIIIATDVRSNLEGNPADEAQCARREDTDNYAAKVSQCME
jgi:hypothetical protein